MISFKTLDYELLRDEIGEKSVFQLLNNFYLSYENFESKLSMENKELKSCVHKLKGAAGNIKAKEIFEIAIKLEENLQDVKLLDKLKNELKYLLNEISENRKFFETNKEFLSKDNLNLELDELLKDINEYNYIDDDRIDIIINSFLKHTNINKEILEKLKVTFAHGDYSELKKIVLNLKHS